MDTSIDTVSIIISVVQIISVLASAVLFMLGIFAAVRNISYTNPSNPDEEAAVFSKSTKKSLILIAVGLGVYFISRLCLNFAPMTEEDYGIFIIAAQSLLDTVKNVGFLILLPIIIRQWRKTARRNPAKK